MVSSITNLTRNGLSDWMVQRVTAVVLGSYTLFMFGFFALTSDLDYQQWQGLFSAMWFKIYTLAALLALGGHIWIGMWTVATDYVKNIWVRFIVLAVIALTNFVYFVIGFSAVWGV